MKNRATLLLEIKLKLSAVIAFGFVLIFTGACSKDLKATKFKVSATELSSLASQAATSKDASSARFEFHFKNFYTLTNPSSETSCAGDLKTYYLPFDVSGTTADVPRLPASYAADLTLSSETIRPAFIRNISVDLTDANAPAVMNKASSCAYSALNNGVPTSNCATFDYGAIGGVPTNLGGTFLLFGGTTGDSYGSYPDTAYSAPELLTNYHGTTVSCGPTVSGSLSYPDDTTLCNSNLYTLNIDSLPASIATTGGNTLVPGLSSASEPISSWGNLSTATDYVGPPATAGGSIAYNQEAQQVVLFGGSKVVTGQGPLGAGVDTNETWLYDLKKEKWNKVETQANSTSKITNQLILYQTTNTSEKTLYQMPRSIGPRALFGYTSVPKFAYKGMTTAAGTLDFTDASFNPSNSTTIDSTERIVVFGGLTGIGAKGDTYKLNPTFGPEFNDTLSRPTSGSPANWSNFTKQLVQWVETFPSQPLYSLGYGSYNNAGASWSSGTWINPGAYADDLYTSTPVTATDPWTSEKFNTQYTNASNLAYSFGFSPVVGTTGAGSTYQGSVVAAGGFDFNISKNYRNTGSGDSFSFDATRAGGRFKYLGRFGTTADSRTTASFAGIPSDLMTTSFPTSLTSGNLTDMVWRTVTNESDVTTAAGAIPINQRIPWFGGGVLLPGFDRALNELVLFGGTTCRDYLTDTSLTSTDCKFSPVVDGAAMADSYSARYWRFGVSALSDVSNSTALSLAATTNVAMIGTPPQTAGLVGARGRSKDEAATTTVIVAWGGMSAAATPASGSALYILYNNAGVPTWVAPTTTPTLYPDGAANAQMVYSHVTGKFYLYGGVRSVNGNLKSTGETWELEVSGTVGSYTASWKRLDTAGGMTCFPECPSVRRSHRMTEVNYNNLDPTLTHPTCTSADTPCSFGIFMEGGTSDGYTLLSDRWMFDPTANGGAGHWQRVDTFPPRHLAAMTSISYFVPSLQKKVNRTILFGGETAFHTPQEGRTDEYFVAPTLGDTWMFDHESQTWNRVELLGKGYNGAVSGITFPSEFEKRQAYDATSPAPTSISELAPPALSGAMMVARTFPQALKNSSTAVTPLAIPQIYLFGGRTKDGKTLGFDSVYKFCAGTTGERWAVVDDTTPTNDAQSNVADQTYDDASCDAYNGSSTNSNTRSQSPVSEFKARWLRKNPSGAAPGVNYPTGATQTIDGSLLHSYLGAAAYDPLRDKVAVYGGIGKSTLAAGTSESITKLSADRTASSTDTLEYIYEYTFPSKSNTNAINADYQRHGYWSRISYCSWINSTTEVAIDADTDIPVARHGHTMAFDQLNKQLVVVGGYGKTGALLTQDNSQTAISATSTYTTPEVWTAQRIDSLEEFPSGYEDSTVPNTFPCYFWKQKKTFSNSTQIAAQIPPSTALGHTAAVYIPAAGYNTGYYTFQDQSCAKAGPVASSDPAVSKLNAGGIYIDLDRNELGTRENVLLNLTYIPLGIRNQRPDGTPLTTGEEAVIKIHLMKTGQSRGQLQMTYQPRYLMYAAPDQFPKTVQTLSVLAPATGEPRTDQVLIPLGVDSGIDRIRIERYSGSAILIDAGLFRMGEK